MASDDGRKDEQMGYGNNRTLMLGLITTLLLCTIINCSGQQAAQPMNGQSANKSMILGGSCRYQSFPGVATIVSITAMPQADGIPYRGYDVKFMFKPDHAIPQSFAQPEGALFPLRLTNSWPPGPQFLQRYGITIGKTFPCVLKVILEGTCTPLVFEFPTINLSDFREGR